MVFKISLQDLEPYQGRLHFCKGLLSHSKGGGGEGEAFMYNVRVHCTLCWSLQIIMEKEISVLDFFQSLFRYKNYV